MGTAGEVFSESRTGCRELFQRGQSVTPHGMPVKTVGRLVEGQESLDIVRIEFKKLVDEALGNFGGRQVYWVEGAAEEGQQIESSRLQAWAEVKDIAGRALSPGTLTDAAGDGNITLGQASGCRPETLCLQA